MEPIVAEASLTIDSSDMTVHQLRATIRDRVLGVDASRMALQLKSFGFKRGLPIDADQVYDLRMLPNLTGTRRCAASAAATTPFSTSSMPSRKSNRCIATYSLTCCAGCLR